MPTIFSRIIAGELPGTFVWRDEDCVAFMSINPIATGHVLVVPILEVDHWLDLPPGAIEHLSTVARRIGQAQMLAFAPVRVGLIVAGFEVPHTHVHVIPMRSMADVSFENAARSVTPESIKAAADAIVAHLDAD
jgi:histidine triad (HIT) family protein